MDDREIECPSCEAITLFEWEDLPERACDSEEIECDCGTTITVGWRAEVEIRGHTPGNGGSTDDE